MCEYCEKGQRLKAKDKYVNSVMHIYWEDCNASLYTRTSNAYGITTLSVPILYCPWCGRDLRND